MYYVTDVLLSGGGGGLQLPLFTGYELHQPDVAPIPRYVITFTG